MRRIVLIVALLAVWLGRAPAAAAHSCANPVQIDPGRRSTVTVGVAAEEFVVTEVDVHVPSGFDVDGVVDAAGWTSSAGPDTVTFTGGTIQLFACGFFSITGTAPRKATLVFPVTVKGAEGHARKYTSERPFDPFGAQLVYAGTTPPGVEDEGGSGGAATVVVVVVAAAAGLAVAGWALRSARGRSGPSSSPRGRARRSARPGRAPPATGSSPLRSRRRRRPRRS